MNEKASSDNVEVGNVLADRGGGSRVNNIIKCVLKKHVREVWSEFIWLRNESDGEVF
jgi:hypothetical protein